MSYQMNQLEPRKVRDYLLSLTHPVGRHKAAFFLKLGFDREGSGLPDRCPRDHPRNGEATQLEASRYGRKFQVVGEIGGERVVTVWIILDGEKSPRLITAYPGGKP
jgi:hypothetical protein